MERLERVWILTGLEMEVKMCDWKIFGQGELLCKKNGMYVLAGYRYCVD